MIINELELAGLAGLALLGLTALGLALRVAGLRRRLARVEAEVAGLRADLEAVGNGGLAALERLDRLEPAAEQLAERVGTVESTSQARPYEQAVAAARRGAGRDELVRKFSLTAAEADLILAVHRPPARR